MGLEVGFESFFSGVRPPGLAMAQSMGKQLYRTQPMAKVNGKDAEPLLWVGLRVKGGRSVVWARRGGGVGLTPTRRAALPLAGALCRACCFK